MSCKPFNVSGGKFLHSPMMTQQTTNLWSVLVVKIEKRHIEFLEEAEMLMNLEPLRCSSDKNPDNMRRESDGHAEDSAYDSDEMVDEMEERRHHFIYICRKRV